MLFPADTLQRVALWFGCCCLVLLFFLVFLGANGLLDSAVKIGELFVLPMGLLYLPVVIALKDTGGKRLWVLLTTGTLLGPFTWICVSLLVWVYGPNGIGFWQSDPDVPGPAVFLALAAFLSLLLTAVYSALLRTLLRDRRARPTPRTPKHP